MSWTVGKPKEHGTYNACNVYDGEDPICTVFGIPTNQTLEDVDQVRFAEGLAKARLIASAPELLATVKRIHHFILAGHEIDAEEMRMLEEVIRKAETR